MRKLSGSVALGLICLMLSSISGLANADEIRSTKPFADVKVALQISDNDPFKQTLVLNVANNLLKAYGPDKVDIEIVAFGPGLRLLFADNANKGRIDALASNGVRFSACGNTIRNMSKQLGEPIKLEKNAVEVSGGIVQIVDLVKAGYILVKP
jgi:intracellular sulfur oxidation DsrE/DsrF family protein